jgi:uncharacterized protein YbjT (DUF2867 family)
MRVILFGATGMVGSAALLECIDDSRVGSVLSVVRRPGDIRHSKVEEIVHDNFFNYGSIQSAFAGSDACFFCLGISSAGLGEAEYRRQTYDLTLAAARAIVAVSPRLTFCYVSGVGTDSSEHGRVMWARVKGATENALMRLFPNAYMFRPAMMRATPGQKNTPRWYPALAWIYPIGRALAPAHFCTLQEVARAMINAASKGYAKRILEVKDIVELAKG